MQVMSMGAHSFLWLLTLWGKLCTEFKNKPRPLSHNNASRKTVKQILSVTVRINGPKGVKGELRFLCKLFSGSWTVLGAW